MRTLRSSSAAGELRGTRHGPVGRELRVKRFTKIVSSLGGDRMVVKSGDQVKVIRGKDRGAEGKVLSRPQGRSSVVEGVQIVKKHVRANQQGQEAGIVSVEAPIHRSNVMVIDPETKKPHPRGSQGRQARDGKAKGPHRFRQEVRGKELAEAPL